MLMSYLRYLCFLLLRIVVSNTYCVMFLFCFSSSMLPVSVDCLFVIAPSVFCNVYSVRLQSFFRTLTIHQKYVLEFFQNILCEQFCRSRILLVFGYFKIWLLSECYLE